MRGISEAAVVVLVVAFTLAGTGPAHAYLDPGTGSIIIQSILGAIAAVVTFGAFYWTKLKGYVRSLRDRIKGAGDPKRTEGER